MFIVDRAKDMVLRGGENIYCSEVEAAIYEHDGVAEVAVFGVPDERLGEEVGAVIVLRDGFELDADELRDVPRRPHRQAQDPGDDLVPRQPAAAQRQRQVPEARAACRARGRLTAASFARLTDGGRSPPPARPRRAPRPRRGRRRRLPHRAGLAPGRLPRRLAVLHDLRDGDRDRDPRTRSSATARSRCARFWVRRGPPAAPGGVGACSPSSPSPASRRRCSRSTSAGDVARRLAAGRQLALHLGRASPTATCSPAPSAVLHFWSLAIEEQFYVRRRRSARCCSGGRVDGAPTRPRARRRRRSRIVSFALPFVLRDERRPRLLRHRHPGRRAARRARCWPPSSPTAGAAPRLLRWYRPLAVVGVAALGVDVGHVAARSTPGPTGCGGACCR